MHADLTPADSNSEFLRKKAEESLRAGSPPPSVGALDRNALALLYTMASDPTRSSDALRLLQELQVYQVELDLQRAQLESNEREMSHELSRYQALFALTPAASLVLTASGHIVDANPAAASLLDAGGDNLAGRLLTDFLSPESHSSWNTVLRQRKTEEQAVTCEVVAGRNIDHAAPVRLSVSLSPGDEDLLLVVASHETMRHDSDSARQQR